MKKHRKIAYENISFAFPELSEREKKNLVKKHFQHLGVLLAGSLYSPRMNKEWLDKYWVMDEESKKIEKEVIDSGVGVVLISGHLGTWELLVQSMGIRMKGAGIYKKIRNPYVDSLLFSMRSKNGIRLVPVEESTQVIKLLKSGYWVGFGADQNAGRAGIFVDFLNRPASTYIGPTLMAYLTGSRIMFYTVVSGEKGKVIVRVKDIGFVNKKDFPDRDAAIREFTQRWTKRLEDEIKIFPEQYFWVHRRWRTKPGDFPEHS